MAPPKKAKATAAPSAESAAAAKAKADAAVRAEEKKNADAAVADLKKQVAAAEANLKAITKDAEPGVADPAVEAALQEVVEREAALAAAEEKADALEPLGKDAEWHYCLESSHAREVITDDRFFQSDSEKAPICPVCRREVSAVPTTGYGVYPSGILAVAARLS